MRNDIEPLGELKGGALLLVDCVTSLGGIPVEIDGWGVDIAYSGTQKCLGAARRGCRRSPCRTEPGAGSWSGRRRRTSI
ncbi:MAG: aminotransferase class V-fold PLP-dependent enzyme [Acidimicrobiales bacterium]